MSKVIWLTDLSTSVLLTTVLQAGGLLMRAKTNEALRCQAIDQCCQLDGLLDHCGTASLVCWPLAFLQSTSCMGFTDLLKVCTTPLCHGVKY